MPIATYAFQARDGVVASSSGTGWHNLGFRARALHFDNIGAVPIYVRLNVGASTDCAQRASTTDITLGSCTGYNWADFTFDDRGRVGHLTIMATSTAVSAINIRAIG